MKKNGFVQAVTKAIGYGTDRDWSTLYYIDAGDTYNERMPYDGPMLEDVSIGPEFWEFRLFVNLSRALKKVTRV